MVAYKLFRQRKDGSLGSLFINRKARIPFGQWLTAENIPTKGFAVRPGFHCTHLPEAPHLSEKDRIWCLVQIKDFYTHERPARQGGLWYTANQMKVLRTIW